MSKQINKTEKMISLEQIFEEEGIGLVFKCCPFWRAVRVSLCLIHSTYKVASWRMKAGFETAKVFKNNVTIKNFHELFAYCIIG